jgi:hypothetical protein
VPPVWWLVAALAGVPLWLGLAVAGLVKRKHDSIDEDAHDVASSLSSRPDYERGKRYGY